jgi:flagellar hook-length control protein FliK
MNPISTALLEPPAPPPGCQGKEPPGSPSARPFVAVLDDHQARTAVAEGHRRAEREPDAGTRGRVAERDGREPAADDDATPAQPERGADAPTLAALLGGVPLPSDAAVPVAPVAAAGSTEPDAPGGRVLSPGEAFREQARGIVLTRATRPIGAGADVSAPAAPAASDVPATPLRPATAPSPSMPIGLGAATADGREMAAATPTTPAAVARAARLADVLQAPVRPAAAAATDASVTPSPATVAGGGRAQGGADGQRPAQAATPAASATPTSAPATPVTPPAAASASTAADTPLPVRAVGLEHAVETVRLALRHGAERGVTHARISLTPRELGSIEVHLRQTADGLVARVVAEHASAAQQLQQAGAELRRQLESQGLTLLRLDIGASGDERADRRGSAFDSAAAFGERDGGGRGADADPLAPLDGTADADRTTTLQLPNGALVDVLA